MKLGLMSAALPDLSLEQLADWAAAEQFAMLELACWPVAEGPGRRYAGVAHLDVTRLTEADAARVRRIVEDRGLQISSLGYYPNPLHPDLTHRTEVIHHLKQVILAAEKLEVGIVGTFVGRDAARSVPENLDLFAEVWRPLVTFAGEHGVRIAIENCPMLFSQDEWPGGHNLAATPAIWEEMFSRIPDQNFGLNLDPSHLIWQFIDYERAVYEFRSRIFHVHAKDLELDRQGLYRHGVLSAGMGWQIPRLPGLGEVRWDRFIAALYAVGYDFVLSIEHEDRNFEGSEELVKRGFRLARNVLAPYLV